MITMSSHVLVVKKILKPTKVSMFCDLKVGDKIKLSVEAERAGSKSIWARPGYIKVVRLTSKSWETKTVARFDEIEKWLERYILEEERSCNHIGTEFVDDSGQRSCGSCGGDLGFPRMR